MRRIYARNTIVGSIDKDLAQSFMDSHHKQGAASPNTSVTSVGIFSEDELVGVAQFCSPRTAAKKREYTTELLRLCFKSDVRVIGGAGKLISFYKEKFNPSDIFTYQDTTGENTSVYEKVGFTLVSQDKKKTYLVAPDKKFDEAVGKEKLSVAFASRLGPDKILGTKIGEVFNEDGSRKSNIKIFTDVLGWSLHETSGDKVYEWFNDDVSFYTYKITASDSDKYYFGMRKINIGNATVDDCLNDPYMGSGGRNSKHNKFNNWKKKHSENLQKEILKVFRRKADALNHERELVGDLWQSDLNCLNSVAGGYYTGKQTGNDLRHSVKACEIHGEVIHAGDTCASCTVDKALNKKICEIHGETTFTGDFCRKCLNSKNITMKVCEVHGETKHRGKSCYKCSGSAFKVVVNICEVHGESYHLNGTCLKCSRVSKLFEKVCEIHGTTTHLNDSCMKCSMLENVFLKTCEIHGLVKHLGDSCSTCTAEKPVSFKICEIHGETSHVGDSCASCRADNNVSLKNCPIHGNVKHVGDKCYSCRKSNFTVEICSVHGETNFTSEKCWKCLTLEATVEMFCETHGMSVHVHGVCRKCSAEKSVKTKICTVHGESKHRGDQCYKCWSEKVNHNRNHKDSTKMSCRLCVSEISEGSRKPVPVVETVERIDPTCPLCNKTFKAKHKRQVFCSNPHPTECASCGDSIEPTPRKGQTLYSCTKRDCKTHLSNLRKTGKR